MSDPTNPPPAAPAPAEEPDQEPGQGPARYAVYDDTLGQYVSGVHPTKAKAKADSRAAKGHRTTIRRV